MTAPEELDWRPVADATAALSPTELDGVATDLGEMAIGQPPTSTRLLAALAALLHRRAGNTTPGIATAGVSEWQEAADAAQAMTVTELRALSEQLGNAWSRMTARSMHAGGGEPAAAALLYALSVHLRISADVWTWAFEAATSEAPNDRD